MYKYTRFQSKDVSIKISRKSIFFFKQYIYIYLLFNELRTKKIKYSIVYILIYKYS